MSSTDLRIPTRRVVSVGCTRSQVHSDSSCHPHSASNIGLALVHPTILTASDKQPTTVRESQIQPPLGDKEIKTAITHSHVENHSMLTETHYSPGYVRATLMLCNSTTTVGL